MGSEMCIRDRARWCNQKVAFARNLERNVRCLFTRPPRVCLVPAKGIRGPFCAYARPETCAVRLNMSDFCCCCCCCFVFVLHRRYTGVDDEVPPTRARSVSCCSSCPSTFLFIFVYLFLASCFVRVRNSAFCGLCVILNRISHAF